MKVKIKKEREEEEKRKGSQEKKNLFRAFSLRDCPLAKHTQSCSVHGLNGHKINFLNIPFACVFHVKKKNNFSCNKQKQTNKPLTTQRGSPLITRKPCKCTALRSLGSQNATPPHPHSPSKDLNNGSCPGELCHTLFSKKPGPTDRAVIAWVCSTCRGRGVGWLSPY